jgi:Arc/MetJ family transcription regulator
MHKEVAMRTTLIIDDSMFKKASELTGIKEKTSLVRMGLQSLISRESSKRLAQLGRTEERLKYIKRRRAGK